MLQHLTEPELLALTPHKHLPATAHYIPAMALPHSDAATARTLPHLAAPRINEHTGELGICFAHPQSSGKVLRHLRQVFNKVQREETMVSSNSPTRITNRSKVQQKSLHDEWLDLIENYSQKDITYPKDRLPALWSFAQRMEDQTSRNGTVDEYICGLWRSDIPRGLTFMLYQPAAFEGVPDPATSVSPSWSWASHEGRLRYYGDGRLHKTKHTHDDPLTRPAVLDFCSTAPTTAALAMGRSVRAALTLRCIAVPITGVNDTTRDDKTLLRAGHIEMSLDSMKLVQDLTGKEIICVHMMDFCGLLVVPSESSTEYKRVGLAYVRHQGSKSFADIKHEYLQLAWQEMELTLV